jgi:hypothetical protein
MSRNTSLSELINYVSASSSGNVTVAPPASGFALEVFGTGRYSGALSGSSAAFTSAVTASAFIPTGTAVPTNGMYLPAANTLAFATSGSVDMTLTSTGNVGIGTTSPSSPLDVVASNSTAIHLRLRGRAADNVGQMEFWNNDQSTRYGYIATDSTSYGIVSTQAIPLVLGTNSTERMRITSAGNVGIGTTAPNSILEISSVTPVFRIQASDSASFHGIEFRQGAGFDAFIKQLPTTGEFRISNGRSVGWGGFTTFYTDTVERMRITSGGNVGIGTTSVLQTLTLAGTQMMYNTAGDGNTNTVIGSITSQVRNYGTNIATNSFASIQFATDPSTWFRGDIRFLTNGSDGTGNAPSERMRINSAGRLIVGATSDGATGLVQIHGTARAVQLVASEGGITAGNYAVYGHDDNNGYINVVRSVFTGDFNFRFDGTTRATINRSTGAYTATSDSRLKTNIADSQSVLSLINQIKVRSYNWIGNDIYEPYGLIAQELYEIFPQYVYKPKNESENWGLSKGELVPVLVKALQELKSELDTANARIQALENK